MFVIKKTVLERVLTCLLGKLSSKIKKGKQKLDVIANLGEHYIT